MAHLNGAGDQNLVVNAPTLTACPAADPAFVHLDMLFCAATDAVLVRAHHSDAQLAENLKSCLIPRDPKLALYYAKLNNSANRGRAPATLMRSLLLVGVCVNRIGKEHTGHDATSS